ncbi:MAG: hypothetical protein H6Q70_1794 [Firmicutes bacterium]|nr:hypothetical protein [Bacillota bacterium]
MLGTVRGSEGVVLLYVDEQHLAVTTQMRAYRRPAACLSIVCVLTVDFIYIFFAGIGPRESAIAPVRAISIIS